MEFDKTEPDCRNVLPLRERTDSEAYKVFQAMTPRQQTEEMVEKYEVNLEQISLLTRRIAILQKGLEEIANNYVLGPSEIGPLHGAGMADGIYIQAKIATQTLKEAEECK